MIRALWVGLFALVLSGCITTGPGHFDVSVNGLSDGAGIRGAKYYIISGDDKLSAHNLQFKEFSRYLSNALQIRGMIPAPSLSEADVAVLLDYGIGKPSRRYIDVPVYGKTGIASKKTVIRKSEDGTVTKETDYSPSFGVKGYRKEGYNVYRRYFVAGAVAVEDLAKGNGDDILWFTEVSSIGTVGDLRYAMPALMAVGARYLGINTGRNIALQISEDDPLINRIKGLGNVSTEELLLLSRKLEQ